MAKYTITLRDILKDENAKAEIDKALSTYPLYVKKSLEEFIPCYIPTREELNTKLLNHFKYREIGFDTVGRFIDELEIAMKEIMPYYNQVLFSLDQDYNILYNVDYTRDIDVQRDGEVSGTTITASENSATSTGTDSSTTKANVTADSKHVESATPQGEIGISASDIDSVPYADKVAWDNNNSDDSGTTTGNSQTTAEGTQSSDTTTTGTNKDTEITLERVKGNYGQVSIQSLIEAYRDLIANVEQDIIRDKRIRELFMMVF
jgi:hypothetical protein